MLDYVIEGDLISENYGLSSKIISKFDHVINIETKKTKGFAITDSNVVLAPYHIKIPDYIFKKILNSIEEKSKIKIYKDKITYNKNKYSYSNKNIFKGIIKDCSSIKKNQLIKWTEKVIKDTVGFGSLDHSILNYKEIINDKQNYNLTVLQKEFYKKLKNVIQKKNSINNLLGLGIGLLPLVMIL